MPVTPQTEVETALAEFELDVQVTTVMPAGYTVRPCDTSDTCASTCASSCASA